MWTAFAFLYFVAGFIFIMDTVGRINRITLKYGLSLFSSNKKMDSVDKKNLKKYLSRLLLGIIIAPLVLFALHLLNKYVFEPYNLN